MAHEKHQQPDTSEPSNERKAELEVAYQENVAQGKSPYNGVQIVTLGEFNWILQRHNWTSRLTNAELSGVNLARVNLGLVYLPKANLSKAILTDANLHGAFLEGADLRGAFLDGVDLSSTNLEEVDLSGTTLKGANLSQSYMIGANLSSANLSGANLKSAILPNGEVFHNMRQMRRFTSGKVDYWKPSRSVVVTNLYDQLQSILLAEIERLKQQLHEWELRQPHSDTALIVTEVRKVQSEIAHFEEISRILEKQHTQTQDQFHILHQTNKNSSRQNIWLTVITSVISLILGWLLSLLGTPTNIFHH